MKYSVMLIVYFLMFLIEAPASPRLKGWPEKFEASDNCDGEDEMKGLEAWRCASASAEGGTAELQWEDCRYKLLGKLALSCGQRKVKEERAVWIFLPSKLHSLHRWDNSSSALKEDGPPAASWRRNVEALLEA